MTILEEIELFGHENILCTHNSTIEITRDTHLTKRGNCILGIQASKACYNLKSKLKKTLKEKNLIKVTIRVEDLIECFYGYGDKDLLLSDKNDMVFRKSNYICERTVLVQCTKSSKELDRDLVKKISTSGRKFSLTFEIGEFDE